MRNMAFFNRNIVVSNRRQTLSGISALAGSVLLRGCAATPLALKSQIARPLNPITPDPVISKEVGSGYILSRGKEVLSSYVSGYAQVLSDTENTPHIERATFTLETPFRVASISKLPIAMMAYELSRRGELDLDVDVQDVLNIPFRHPSFPDQPIRLRDLLGHRSALKDPSAYWMAHPGNIRDLVTEDIWVNNTSVGPGEFFTYANVNTSLAATVIELSLGERFDILMSEYLGKIGLDVGYNWSGVSDNKRKTAATLYRRNSKNQWVIQTDGPKTLNDIGPHYLGKEDHDLSSYTLGQNGTLFSPQGGLRASLLDLDIIASHLLTLTSLLKTDWVYDADLGNGFPEDNHFLTYGPGFYAYPKQNSPIKGESLYGHHGEAYGLYSGLWVLPERGLRFCYAVCGTQGEERPMSGRIPNNTIYAQAFLNVLAQHLQELGASR